MSTARPPRPLAHLQMALRRCSCSGVRRARSRSAPRDVFGHLEPEYSAGRPDTWHVAYGTWRLARGRWQVAAGVGVPWWGREQQQGVLLCAGGPVVCHGGAGCNVREGSSTSLCRLECVGWCLVQQQETAWRAVLHAPQEPVFRSSVPSNPTCSLTSRFKAASAGGKPLQGAEHSTFTHVLPASIQPTSPSNAQFAAACCSQLGAPR